MVLPDFLFLPVEEKTNSMKRLILYITLLIFPFSVIIAQNQIENPGFEEWEPDDENSPFFEPVDWSSVKTSNNPASVGSPVVIFRSDDARSGNYSVHLINKYTDIIEQTVTGTMTNGRIHVDPGLDPAKSNSYTDVNDSRWNTPLTKKPDSIIGWYKAKPVPDDFPTVKMIIHQDSNSIPGDSSKWIARAFWKGERGVEVNQWTRFSAPIDYYLEDTPEFILSILTAGNGLHAKVGSEVWFDDVELIYNGTDIPEKVFTDLNVWYSNGKLTIRLSGQRLTNGKIKIADLAGRIIYSGTVSGEDINNYRLNLTKGVYILNLSSSQGKTSEKFVVQ
jgi:hypothetical protein